MGTFQGLKIGNFDVKITPVNYNEPGYEDVDLTGKPVKRKMEGRGRTVFYNDKGEEVPKTDVCKLIKGKPVRKLKKSKVIKNVVEMKQEEAERISRDFLDRKFYFAHTDDKELQDLILKKEKALQFIYTNGNGYKLYKAVLMNHNGKMVMVCGLGDLSQAMEQYGEEEVSLDIPDETESLSEEEMADLVE